MVLTQLTHTQHHIICLEYKPGGLSTPCPLFVVSACAESLSPFHSSHARSSQPALEAAGGSGGLPPSTTNSGLSTPTASAHHSAGLDALPTTTSFLDFLQQGRGSGRRMRASGTGSGTGEQLTQTGSNAVTPRGGGSSGSLVATATANAAGLSLGGFAKLTHSSSWSAVRAAEARAAALSGIKAMPEKPLVLLYQLVELMKVLVDQLREKCLEERVESAASRQEKQEAAEGKAAAAAAAAASAGGAAAAMAAAAASGGGGEKQGGSAHTLQHSNSNRGTSSSAYSSLTTAPDDWRLDDNKPCSGERLLLMFDRWGGGVGGAQHGLYVETVTATVWAVLRQRWEGLAQWHCRCSGNCQPNAIRCTSWSIAMITACGRAG